MEGIVAKVSWERSGKVSELSKQNIEVEERDVGLSGKLKVSGCEVSKEETKPWHAASPRSSV